MDLVSPGSRITTEFFCCFPACGSSLNLRAITSLSVKTWLAIVAVSLKTPRLTEILDDKIHTIRTHKKRVTLGNCGRKTDRETDKRSRTHIHTHFLTAREKKGHLQFCQALQGGQRSGFDNWREFREQTFDKHDNALTALIGQWLMTDISVACLLQNANAALGENYPNVAPNLMQEVSRKARTRRGFFCSWNKALL